MELGGSGLRVMRGLYFLNEGYYYNSIYGNFITKPNIPILKKVSHRSLYCA